MKRSMLAIACGLSALLATAALADDPKPRTAARDTQTDKLDTTTAAGTVRASQLIGTNIQNSQGESVGEINDLVLDSKTGKIRFVAVTYGGFLGVGNKMFAVPFEAFQAKHDPDDPNDPDDYVLVLNVTQQQLEGAQGFDEDHWPNFASRTFTEDLDRRYRIERRTGRADDVDVNVDRNGVDVDVDAKPRANPN
jgi:sporulation protein YlmC with PRC-barrel domain